MPGIPGQSLLLRSEQLMVRAQGMASLRVIKQLGAAQKATEQAEEKRQAEETQKQVEEEASKKEAENAEKLKKEQELAEKRAKRKKPAVCREEVGEQGKENTKKQEEGRQSKEEIEEKAKQQSQTSENEEQEDIQEEETIEDIVEEEKAYEELAKELTSPAFMSELAQAAQQATQQVQNPTQAQELANEIAKLAKQLQARVQRLQFTLADGVDGSQEQVEQELNQLDDALKNVQASLAGLCKQYNLQIPDTKPELPISEEMLKGAFNQALDTLLPASDLIKIAMGTMEMPTTKEEWVKVAVSTVLDSMPFGKMFKLLQSSAAKLGVKKIIEAKILIIAAKKVKKAGKAGSTVLQTGGHTLKKQTLKTLKITKDQGKTAIESLERSLNLPPNLHGKIMTNGDVVHPHTGEILGNLFDYLN